MSWSIKEELNTYNNYTTGIPVIRMNIVCDDVSDLPSSTQVDWTFCMGSKAKVISNGKTYLLDSTGAWIEQPSDSAWVNVYTKSEMDAIIQDVIDGQLTRGDIFRGYQIVANTDVDTLTDYGCYYCSDGTTAATLSNCPITTSGFIMLNFSTGNRVRLFLAVSANTPRMYIQARTSSVWRTIRQFAMLDEVQADENMLGFAWQRCTVSEDTGNILPSTTRIGSDNYFEIPNGTNTIVYSPMFDGARGETFYLFYDSNQTYNNNYIGWVSAGVPVKVPANMKYYRLAFRRPDNATIIVSDMIRCTRNYQ